MSLDSIKTAFQHLIKRVFDIREGELSRALLMQVCIFLIISTLLIVKPTVNGLFIAKIGVEKLPLAFILVAVFAAGISWLYSRLLGKHSLWRIQKVTFVSSVLTLITFGLLLRLNVLEGWVLYVFYIWVAIFAVLSASQFWILANIVFNVREAKRLFGFIGSGAIAGGIFGGYLTSILAHAIGAENLLFVSAGLLSCTLPLLKKIWATTHDHQNLTRKPSDEAVALSGNPIRLILQSKHLFYLASIIGVSVVVAKLVDYQFGAIASFYIPDPDALTSFFGFWFSNMNLLSLGVQLFLTRRVVGTFGVGSSLLFLPGAIFFAALLVLFFPVLGAAVLIKLADGSLKQSINRASVELLALPIPLEIKNRTKTFIDVFVDSAATGLSGLMLVFMVIALDLSPRMISILILLLLGLWVHLAVRIRREYLRTFRSMIEQPVERAEPGLPDLSVPSVLGGLRKVLYEGSEKQKRYVLNKALELRDERLFDAILQNLDHPSPEIQVLALRNLYFLPHHDIRPKVRALIPRAHPSVKIAAFEYLIQHSPEDLEKVMKEYLNEQDLKVRGAAIASLAIETKNNPVLRENFHLQQQLSDYIRTVQKLPEGEPRQELELFIIRAIGAARFPSLYDTLEYYLSSSDPEQARESILAAGKTLSPHLITKLLKLLENDKLAVFAAKALAGYGPAIIQQLKKRMKEKPDFMGIWRKLPIILEQIHDQRSVEFLFELLDYDDAVVRLESLKALNALKNSGQRLKFSDDEIFDHIHREVQFYRITLSFLYVQAKAGKVVDKPLQDSESKAVLDARRSLIVLLERRLDGTLERIFRLLGLKYPPKEIFNIYQGLRSDKPDLRESALEFLDNLLEANLKKILIPIVETTLLDNISSDIVKQLNLRIPDEDQCLRMLLQARDIRIKYAVLYLIGEMGKPSHSTLVHELIDHPNENLRNMARKVAEGLQ